MVYCCIATCRSKSGRGSGRRFFCIPSVIKNQCDKTKSLSSERRKLWLLRINRKDLQEENINKNKTVCDLHFISGTPSKLFDNKSPDWAPSVALGYEKRKARILCRAKVKKDVNDVKINNATDAFEENMELDNKPESPIKLLESGNKPAGPMKTMESDCNAGSLVNKSEPDGEPCNLRQKFNLGCRPVTLVKKRESDDRPDSFVKKKVEPNERPTNIVKNINSNVKVLKLDNKSVKVMKLDGESIKLLKLDVRPAKMVTSDAGHMTDVLGTDIDLMKIELDMTRNDNIALRTSCNELKSKLNYCAITEESFKADNDKVKFYTGIPMYSVLKSVFDLVTKDRDFTIRNSLTRFQEFLLVLMRLRLNLLEQDLAYRFGVSQATVSRINSKWLPLMANQLRCFIVWPDRDSLKGAAPQFFKDITKENVCVVLDCIKFYITRPSSQSKHKQNGVKFLLGITPQGFISFVSRAPSCSDEEIIENCGILDHLSEGDVIIMNRNLNSEEDTGFSSGKVVYMDKSQLIFEDLVPSKNLAQLKRHVENTIGFVRKKYHILQDTLAPEIFSVRKGQTEAPIDNIVVICCALANLCRSIVIDSTQKVDEL